MESKKFDIYINIENQDIRLGTLYVSFLKGKECYSFEMDKEYVENNYCYLIDPEINQNLLGRQYKNDSSELYGFLKDVTPDRWGRKLINKHYKNKKLTEIDYMILVDDETRCGAIRIMENGQFLSVSENPIPSFMYIRELEQAALLIDEVDDNLKLLLQPGSSLGGSRPKANVYDNNKEIYLAKFPSRNDDYDVEKYEYFVNELAKMCGIDVPENKIFKLSSYGSTLLLKRFDREKNKRLPYISLMSLLSAQDGTSEQYSYLNILEIIKTYSFDSKKDSLELYKRMIFNIIIHNGDDHLRNFGFLYSDGKWRLSPAFDLNPIFDSNYLTLSIDGESFDFNLSTAIKSSKLYSINENEANDIVNNMKKVISENFHLLVKKCKLNKKENEMMANLLRQSIDGIF